MIATRTNHLRKRGGHESGRVTYVELFFDLVFVFAVTQLSHGLLHHLTPLGALETGLLMMAVWWVWIYTSWITNWLDPERMPVRLMLFALMAAGLVLSASIPAAFAARGASFAIAFVFMQVGRSLFMLWALKHHDAGNFRNFLRITVWLSVSGVFWIAGGFADPHARLGLWAIAVAIEYASPAAGMWVPGLGRSTTADWQIDGGHLAERCALFVIIALGESVLVTGATFADMAWTTDAVAAFAVALTGSIAMWTVYFNVGAERASRQIAHSDDPGRLARSGYTYLHILIVAGIIVSAVADELVLSHPVGHTEPKALAAIVGAPALYLLGTALFKRLTAPNVPLSHLAGLGLLAVLAIVGLSIPPLALSAATSFCLVVVGFWEWASLKRRR
ncbi:MAG: low temperature requirement protein A [Proteobacteria bacterium]|nr:low temperature requirement protein A [Pseudomonadota bacterium]